MWVERWTCFVVVEGNKVDEWLFLIQLISIFWCCAIGFCIFWWSRVVKNNFSWWHEQCQFSFRILIHSNVYGRYSLRKQLYGVFVTRWMLFLALQISVVIHYSSNLITLEKLWYFAMWCMLLLPQYSVSFKCNRLWCIWNWVLFILKQMSSFLSTEEASKIVG